MALIPVDPASIDQRRRRQHVRDLHALQHYIHAGEPYSWRPTGSEDGRTRYIIDVDPARLAAVTDDVCRREGW